MRDQKQKARLIAGLFLFYNEQSGGTIAFSNDADIGSRDENASNQKPYWQNQAAAFCAFATKPSNGL